MQVRETAGACDPIGRGFTLRGMPILDRIVARFAPYQVHVALLCVVLLGIDASLVATRGAGALPLLVVELLVLVAAAVGVQRPTEAAARLAKSSSVTVWLTLLAAIAGQAAVRPPDPTPVIDVEVVEPAEPVEAGGTSG